MGAGASTQGSDTNTIADGGVIPQPDSSEQSTFDDFLLPVQVGRPRKDMWQNTIDLLCADSRYTETECRQLAASNGSVEFQRIADSFVDYTNRDEDRLLQSLTGLTGR